MDNGRITALVLLDLSSAFDTVNHNILLNTLTSLGIKGQAYKWFKSYLSDHHQIVCIDGHKSDSSCVTRGVPQGSVGGPTLFSLYLIGLKHVLENHCVNYRCYADDIQLYISFEPTQIDAVNAIQKLEACIMDVQNWMSLHSLKLNNAKSEFIMFGSKAQLYKVNITSMTMGNTEIPLSSSCRNLGVMLDSNMTMSVQISNVCKSVRYQLRNLGFIRKYLTCSSTQKIVHALISSRLDFGNALLYLLPQSQLTKLQKLQNTAARIVTLTKKFSHITPVLQTLHWLPIVQRIKFKILLFTFHCIHGSAPSYNTSLIQPYNPTRPLRSSQSGLLSIPSSKKSWGDRAFAHAGPSLWNELPPQIRNITSLESFKTSLKTHLFQVAFNDMS